MRRYYLMILFAFVSVFAFSESKDTQMINGKDWAYLIAIPNDLKLDNRTLARSGISGLFYRVDQKDFDDNGLYISINPIGKGNGLPEDLESLIKWSNDSLLTNDNSVKISFMINMELGDISSCSIYKVDSEKTGKYSYFGYAADHKVFFVFVLNAMSKDERLAYENDYFKLMESFVFIDKE